MGTVRIPVRAWVLQGAPSQHQKPSAYDPDDQKHKNQQPAQHKAKSSANLRTPGPVGTYPSGVADMWWQNLPSFLRDLGSASDERLREMYDWAKQREAEAEHKGLGRNPKARRMFRQMADAAAERLDERGLLWE